MPAITVLMPVHNQAPFLRLSLASVLSQTVADLEVLVVGDGCTDQSAEVVHAAADPRVRWLGFPKAPGYGYANRERALGEARGDLVAYLAPDDLWAPRHLETLLAELSRDGLDFVFSQPIIVRPDGRRNPHYFPFDIAAGAPRVPVLPRLYFLSPTQVLQTREIVRRAGGWDGRVRRFGDIDLWLRCRSVGARIRYVPCPTALRLPSLLFRQTSPRDQERLQAEILSSLQTGQFDAWSDQLGRARRALGWCLDAASVGWSKGPAFVRARRSHRRLRSR